MRAAVYSRYGAADVVTVQERPMPAITETEVLVHVRAIVVTAADAAARSGTPFVARMFFGLFRPRLSVLGSDFAGEIEAVGSAVTRFRVGDRVIGSTGATLGAHVEYLAAAESSTIIGMPKSLSFGEAIAAVEGARTALPFLRDAAALTTGQRILINGAAGSVGSAAVQLAHHLGAHVTAVCSARNADVMRSIGADDVIDYATQDFTAARDSYDVIFDAVGKSSFGRSRAALTGTGIYLTTVPTPAIMLQKAVTAKGRGRRASIVFAGLLSEAEGTKNLIEVVRLVDAGSIVPVIDQTFDISEIAEAHRLVDTGHKRGNAVVTF